MWATWIGLFMLGGIFAYRHLRALKFLVLRQLANPILQCNTSTLSDNKQSNQFQMRWWAHQAKFFILTAILTLILKKLAVPFLLGIVSFEAIGKKIILYYYMKKEKGV